jgi:hypothetical protein
VTVCTECGEPATHQAPRPATEQEATAHWDAVEANIRASGTPGYVADRTDTVEIADPRCDQHPHPEHAEALANQTPNPS